jgi:hypothetical protein
MELSLGQWNGTVHDYAEYLGASTLRDKGIGWGDDCLGFRVQQPLPQVKRAGTTEKPMPLLCWLIYPGVALFLFSPCCGRGAGGTGVRSAGVGGGGGVAAVGARDGAYDDKQH